MIVIPLPVVPAARSTIAPPNDGQRLNLLPPFKPHAGSVTRQELWDVCHVEPFALLPRMLIPIPAAIYRPPTMHYGWSAPRETLLAYAKEHGLTLMMHRRNPPLPDESDAGESSDDDASDSSTDDDTEDTGSDDDDSSSKRGDESDGSGAVVVERTRKPLLPLFLKAHRIDEPASMVAALEHISTQLSKDGLRVATLDLHSTLQHGEGEQRIISVYSNFHLLRKDLPSPEDIRKLGEAVGITAPPKWYIDSDMYDWYLIRDPYSW